MFKARARNVLHLPAAPEPTLPPPTDHRVAKAGAWAAAQPQLHPARNWRGAAAAAVAAVGALELEQPQVFKETRILLAAKQGDAAP